MRWGDKNGSGRMTTKDFVRVGAGPRRVDGCSHQSFSRRVGCFPPSILSYTLVLDACISSLDDDPAAYSAAHDDAHAHADAHAREHDPPQVAYFPPARQQPSTRNDQPSFQLPSHLSSLPIPLFPAHAAMSRPNISYPSPIPGPSTSSSSSSYPQQPLEPSPYLRQPAPRQDSGPSRAQVSETAIDHGCVRWHAPSILCPISSERDPANTLCAAQPNVLDSIITKLLVTTKQLLQGLEQWSQGIISEEDVSAGLLRVSSRLRATLR